MNVTAVVARILGPRSMATLAWGLTGYLAVYGWLQWGTAVQTPTGEVTPESTVNIDPALVARALGAPARAGSNPAPAPMPPGAAGPRWVLQGVVAAADATPGSAPRPGVALLTTEGQKAKPYAVGSVVEGQWRVVRVGARDVVLAPVDAHGNADPMHRAVVLTLPPRSGGE